MRLLFGASFIIKRFSSNLTHKPKSLKVAVIGQSQFGADVYRLLKKKGHEVVGVFTIPDQSGRADPLAQAAAEDGVKVFKNKLWRVKGQAIPEVLEQYKSVGAQINVLPFCSQFIPMEVINYPLYKSIIYHPSLLPLHRGASAINWTLICGDKKAGFSVFWADDGLDTGPVLLQRDCEVFPNDTVDTVYNRFLYPEGVKAMGLAVQMIADGTAPSIKQDESKATYEALLKKDLVQINFNQPATAIHNFIRGCDYHPGAWAIVNGQQISFYGSKLRRTQQPIGESIIITGMSQPAIIHSNGITLFGNDGKMVDVERLALANGKMIPASKFGANMDSHHSELVLTEEEQEIKRKVKDIWKGILNVEINDDTDFFACGAGSMDVVRLVEAVKQTCQLTITSEKVYMATTFCSFIELLVSNSRGEDKEEEFSYEPIRVKANNMELQFPNQLFINNEFIDASDGGTFTTINPTDESNICKVAKATKEDVDYAVHCAKNAFEAWKDMNARDRGQLMYKLADLMEAHQEELATLESLDSGAVYTLALKTHVGMSIQTMRYFAGWCDKIHGQTIPINHAKPNHNLSYTRREPIGVCGIITPWNYPLMMLAWKISPCLAAGNTVVLKPAQVTPLTSLKFAELAARAGFPPGVINIIPGSGAVAGQAMADHPDIRKLGFTGSTPVGKTIMSSCANSNLKRVSLELGGKSPLIIFADCDLSKAVRMAISGVFFNKGENCIAAGRIFVEESIHDKFLERVIEEVKKMKIGDPLDRSTDHGPQNHLAHLKSLLNYVKTGVKEGARLVYGGCRVERPGLFMEPTILTDVHDHMFVAREESFGPVMVISHFKDGDIDGVIKSANATEFALASGVFTNDLSKAMTVSSRLEAGTCFVNTYNKTDVATPFGGFKQSGFGKDLGEEALNEYLRTKVVTIEY